jgi:hypothetical protein
LHRPAARRRLTPARSRQDTFWPLALKVSAELRAGNRTERYVYTTFSWLASAYLSCPPNAGLHCPTAAGARPAAASRPS